MAILKRVLSGSTHGQRVHVTGTAASGATTIHTSVSGTTTLDEIWCYGVNFVTTPCRVTLLWGNTAAGDQITTILPVRDGPQLITPGFLLRNAAVVKAFTTGANRCAIHGYVHRVSTG